MESKSARNVKREARAIYLYRDSGVSATSLRHTIFTIEQAVGSNYDLYTIDSKGIKSGTWCSKAALLVLPGGADLPYLRKLAGRGDEIIREYVERGGSFLGICAGAYYGSSFVEFDRGGPLEVLGPRGLSLFPGKAVGPALAKFDYQSHSGARNALVEITLAEGTKNMALFFNGGPYFAPIHTPIQGNYATNHSTEIAGRYQAGAAAGLPAILQIHYGLGVAILSGVHFEYTPELLDSHDPHIAPLLPELYSSQAARRWLTIQLLSSLNLSLN